MAKRSLNRQCGPWQSALAVAALVVIPVGQPSAGAAGGSPSFVNYPAPKDIPPSPGSTTAGQHGAGEPSIGVNWATGHVFIEAGKHSLRVTFNDSTPIATAVWEDKRSPYARVSLDPILFTDSGPGRPNRTFSWQLNGARSEVDWPGPVLTPSAQR